MTKCQAFCSGLSDLYKMFMVEGIYCTCGKALLKDVFLETVSRNFCKTSRSYQMIGNGNEYVAIYQIDLLVTEERLGPKTCAAANSEIGLQNINSILLKANKTSEPLQVNCDHSIPQICMKPITSETRATMTVENMGDVFNLERFQWKNRPNFYSAVIQTCKKDCISKLADGLAKLNDAKIVVTLPEPMRITAIWWQTDTAGDNHGHIYKIGKISFKVRHN